MWDAQQAAEELEQEGVMRLDETNLMAVARRLKQKGYRQTAEQLWEVLKKRFQRRKSIAKRNEFNARMLAHLLGEKKKVSTEKS
jgi:hypothetical protein